jgi:NAD(P)-dependent dehydrogenase (short-subunit alcohol dehydrogenase family)
MAYSVTKAAGLHLMKCIAATQGPKLRMNAILPGQLLTEWVCLFNCSTMEVDAEDHFREISFPTRKPPKRRLRPSSNERCAFFFPVWYLADKE